MLQDLQQRETFSKERSRIEHVRQWTKDIYDKKMFYCLGLYTLELTRRFKDSYEHYEISQSDSDFKNLLSITVKLEEKLLQEKAFL